MIFIYIMCDVYHVFCRSIHHFYGNGNICDVTGKRRVVEVKM